MKVKLLLIGIVVMLGGCYNYISSEYIEEAINTCANRGGIESIKGRDIWDNYITIECKDLSYKKLNFGN